MKEGEGRIRLRKGSVPLRFVWNDWFKKKKRERKRHIAKHHIRRQVDKATTEKTEVRGNAYGS